MNSQEKSKSDSHSSQLLLSEFELDIENVLALNSDYIESLVSIENNDHLALIDNLEVMEDLQLQDVSVDSPERNLSDALSYLKNLECSQTQTNRNRYNYDSEVVEISDDDDKEDNKYPLEVEDVEQGLENMSEINENNGKIVTRSQDGAEYDYERTAHDNIDSKCAPRIGYMVNYLGEEVINIKYAGNKDELECNTQETLAGELTENQAAKNVDIPKKDNLEVVYVIQVIENVRDENIEDVAEETGSTKTLAGTVNESNTQNKDTDDTPMTKINSQVSVDYNAKKYNEANINFASETETRPISTNAEEKEIIEVKHNNSGNNDLSALIDNLEVLEDLQLQNACADSPERNLSDALSYLKNLESSRTQTNTNRYNHDSEVVEITDDDDDKENIKFPLEVEDVEQGLENMSEINKTNGKIVTRSQDGAEYDYERTAHDNIDSKCTPRIGYMVNYLGEEVINMKNAGNNDELECNTQETLAGELTENQAAKNVDIPKKEVVYVIEVIENVCDENIEDVAEETESIKTLAGTVNENNTQDKDTDDTPMTKINSQVSMDYNATKDYKANRNFASETKTRPISRKAEEKKIIEVKHSNSEKNEKTSQKTILQEKDSIVDFENIIREHIITSLQPKELEDVLDDFIIANIGNKDPAKPHTSHTTLPCEWFDVPEPATNSPVAIKERLNISTLYKIEIDKRPNTAAEISKKEDMLLKAKNQNSNVTNPNMSPFFNSDVKEDLIESISLSSEEDDDSDGYHSSDFEMITENDAALHGLIVNKPESSKKLDFSEDQDRARPTIRQRPLERHGVANNYRQFLQSWNSLHGERANILNQAGPSNPQTLTRSYYEARYAKASNRWMDSCNTSESDLAEDFESLEETTRTNHVIPQGEDYERLFQEIHIPMPTRLMENKSTHYRGVGGMQIEDNGQYGHGFDDEENDSYMNLYPECKCNFNNRPSASRTRP